MRIAYSLVWNIPLDGLVLDETIEGNTKLAEALLGARILKNHNTIYSDGQLETITTKGSQIRTASAGLAMNLEMFRDIYQQVVFKSPRKIMLPIMLEGDLDQVIYAKNGLYIASLHSRSSNIFHLETLEERKKREDRKAYETVLNLSKDLSIWDKKD